MLISSWQRAFFLMAASQALHCWVVNEWVNAQSPEKNSGVSRVIRLEKKIYCSQQQNSCLQAVFFLNLSLWLLWVFIAVPSCRELGLLSSLAVRASPLAEHRLQVLVSLVVVVPVLSCFTAYGIFSGEGSIPCLLHRQADSYPLYHRESPVFKYLRTRM